MHTYFLRRSLALIPTMIGIVTVVFFALHLAPGDPAEVMLGDLATPEQVMLLRSQLGLDRPLYVQYLHYLVRAATGDFGRSLVTGQPAMQEAVRLFPYTFALAMTAVAVSLLVGIPAGVVAASRRGTWADRAAMFGALVGISLPVFWLAILLILSLSVYITVFPSVGAGGRSLVSQARHLVLPSVALGTMLSAVTARMVRSSMLENLREDYVRTARSKGVAERSVLYRHVLRNALIPVVTIVGLNMGNVLGGSVVIETVFARPGLGKLLIDSIVSRDYIQVQATVVFIAVLFLLVNLVTDAFYAVLDPRIRYG